MKKTNKIIVILALSAMLGAPITTLAADLPDSVDPRGTSWETLVRNQYQQSMCWAYTVADVLAICEAKQTGHKEEYSPNFFNYLRAGNAFNFGEEAADYKRDEASTNPYAEWFYGGYQALGTGGDGLVAAIDLQTYEAKPVKESLFASGGLLDGVEGIVGIAALAKTPIEDKDSFFALKDAQDQVNDVENVQIVEPNTSAESEAIAAHTQDAKTLLATFGAAQIYTNGYLLQDEFTSSVAEGNVYNNEHNALNVPFDFAAETSGKITGMYNGKSTNTTLTAANHQVTVVGYDDNFSRDNFNEEVRPASDGAFLIKNSWGKGRHDGGYFWLSYESKIANVFPLVAYQFAPHVDHKLLANAKATSAVDIFASKLKEFTGKTYLAETFDSAATDRHITAINTMIAGEDASFKAYLVEGDLNIGGANEDSTSTMDHKTSYNEFKGIALKTVTGSVKFDGEKKIPFDYVLKKNHKYTVVIEEDVTGLAGRAVDYPFAGNPYKSNAEVPGHGYFGVIAGDEVYSLDYKSSPYFLTPRYENPIAASNNITLDVK
jgi:hypothetical protein